MCMVWWKFILSFNLLLLILPWNERKWCVHTEQHKGSSVLPSLCQASPYQSYCGRLIGSQLGLLWGSDAWQLKWNGRHDVHLVTERAAFLDKSQSYLCDCKSRCARFGINLYPKVEWAFDWPEVRKVAEDTQARVMMAFNLQLHCLAKFLFHFLLLCQFSVMLLRSGCVDSLKVCVSRSCFILALCEVNSSSQ